MTDIDVAEASVNARPEFAVVEGRQWVMTSQAIESFGRDKRIIAITPPANRDDLVRACETLLGHQFDLAIDLRDAITETMGRRGLPSAVEAVAEATYVCAPSAPEPNDPRVPLYRALNGRRIHLPDCPHLRGVDIIKTDRDAEFPICEGWCGAELRGEGRTYHPSIAEAMEDAGTPHSARSRIRELLEVVDFDKVFVPNSRSYIAVTRAGKTMAWAGKTYVGYADRPIEFLPDYIAGGGGGQAENQRWGEICPTHGYQKSLTGVCPGCE